MTDNKDNQNSEADNQAQTRGAGRATQAGTGRKGEAEGVKKAGSDKKRTTKDKQDPAEKQPDEETQESLKGLGSVVVRNEYYRDGFRTMQKISLLQAIIILGLIAAMIFVIQVHQPKNRYFATTEDGRLVPMIALNEPNLSNSALLSWTAQAATEVWTFGFHDYKRRLQEASSNFTRRGWASFTQALERSRIIEMVKQNQFVVTAAPRSAPVVISEGVQNGRYTWTVELPLKLTYQAGSKTRSDNLRVRLKIVRVPKLESPNGIGINQWIAYPG
jgi:intracellular multiplication protein IcmL